MTREKRLIIVSGVILLALLSVTLWGDSSIKRTLIEFLILLSLAQMWNLLAGYAGLVSVGQQAWIGIGGYTLIVMADDVGLGIIPSIFMGGVVAGLLAYPTAKLVFRLKGGYFAIGTWVVAEVFRLLVASSIEWLGGGGGRTLVSVGQFDRYYRENMTYLLAVFIGLGAVGLVYGLMRSKIGLGLTAIRDSESAAASLGVNTERLKLLVFIVSAFATGVTGGLIYLNVLRITPNAAFSIQWTSFMLFIVVIGGIGTIEGPLIGTVIFFTFREYFSNFGEWSWIILGIIAIVIMLTAPQGVWGLLHGRFDWHFFPVRRLIPPELLAQFTPAMTRPEPGLATASQEG